jgi:hypothetical protein
MNNRVLATGLLVLSSGFSWQPYSAIDSTEAVLSFSHEVEFTSRTEPDEEFAREKIEAQVNHLFGPMAEAPVKAVPQGNHRITEISLRRKEGTTTSYVASYSYRGTIVLQGLSGSSYDVVLPVNPDRIYRAALRTRSNGREFNPCTDPHYQSEGDFWYFWNPYKPGCELREGIDYRRFSAKVRREANTLQTYPEYHRLADSSGVIRISILMGMDDPTKAKDPNRSADINASNFVGIRRSLESMGFQRRILGEAEIAEIAAVDDPVAYVEEFTKDSGRARIVVQVFFGPSGISEDSGAFHHFLRDALENSSLMIYDGHSGLGGHLDLAAIEETHGFKIRLPRDRYQIYFFNSCSSYTYYNTMYFRRKAGGSDRRGSKNLDIMTNGLATYFSVLGESDMKLIQAIDSWAAGGPAKSYQDLARSIDSDNLFGVNGDEDNPTTAPL